MNKTFRSIWNPVLGTSVAVSEITMACGKSGSSIAMAAVLTFLPVMAAHAQTAVISGTNRINAGLGATSGNSPTIPIWTPTAITIGSSGGSGTLALAGGQIVVTSANSQLGQQVVNGVISTGTATVDGAGTLWNDAGIFLVGNEATGLLTITNGGSVSAGTLALAYQDVAASGTVLVTGSGSSISSASTFDVGLVGIGVLTVSNGGVASAATIGVATNAGSNGTINIGAAAGTPAAAAGTLNTSAVVFGAGTGAINFNHTNSAYVFAAGISGGTVYSTINQYAGVTTLTGDSSGFAGTTYIGGGTLGVTGKLGSTNITVQGLTGSPGTFDIEGAGQVKTSSLGIGASAANGVLTVNGPNSSLRVTSGTTIAQGVNALGTLNVSNGGSIILNSLIAGSGVGAHPAAATINITSGGTLTTGMADLSNYNGAFYGGTGKGTLTFNVTGAGSSWTDKSSTSAIMGNNTGTAVLTIGDGGSVTLAAPLTLANSVGSTGTINIGAAATSAATGSGTLNTSAVNFGAGTGTINFNHTNASYTFAPVISGAGRVNVLAGHTIFTAASTYTGPTTITGGTLSVNGSIASSAVTVSNGGTLGGNGTVGSVTALAGGNVGPGNSIGTLTVNGNYSQAAGSIYQVEVNPNNSSSDRINVLGSATLASGSLLNVTQNPAGLYTLGTRYTVLNATGGVTGTYGLTGAIRTAFVQLYDTYDANNVYLTAEQQRSFASAGGTRNQLATARSLDSMNSSNALVNAMAWSATNADANHASDQLSGEIHASVNSNLLQDSRYVRDAANDRLIGALCSPGADTLTAAGTPAQPAGCSTSSDSVAWSRVFGSTGRNSSDGNAAQLNHGIAGFFVGADTGVAGGWRVGGLFGYSQSTNYDDAVNSSARTDDYHVGVYGGNRWNNTSVRVGAAYTAHRVDSQRSVGFAGFSDRLMTKYNATTSQVFAEVGQQIAMNKLVLEPFVGVAYVNVHSDAFSESGGLAALSGSGSTINSTFGTLGVRSGTAITESTRLRGMVGWRHAFGAGTPSVTETLAGSTPFTVYGIPLASNVGVVEAGIETQINTNAVLNVGYSGQFGNGVRDNGFKATVAWKF
ncbi:autotransporter domain-containing protein [Glaciimonas sp. GNP009]